jgi:phage shock protein A
MAKSFFSRKEGKVGLAVILATLALIGVYHNPIVEYIKTLLTTETGTIGLFAMLGALIFIISDRRIRNLLSYSFKWLMRKITSLFVELDPIKVLESYIIDLEKNFNELSKNISKLRKQITIMRDTVKLNNKEIAKSTRLVDEAKRQGRSEVVAVNLNQIGRLNKLNEKYALMIGRMDDLNNVLIKMHAYSSYKLADTRNEIRMKKQELAAISSGYSAMMNARNIMNGNYKQTELYDTAIDALTNDLHTKIADMDNFMQLSQPLFDDMNLQNAINQMEGERIFEKIMTEGQAFLNKIENSSNGSYFPSKNN